MSSNNYESLWSYEGNSKNEEIPIIPIISINSLTRVKICDYRIDYNIDNSIHEIKVKYNTQSYTIRNIGIIQLFLAFRDIQTKKNLSDFPRVIGELLMGDILKYVDIYINKLNNVFHNFTHDLTNKIEYIESQSIGKTNIYIDNYLSSAKKMIYQFTNYLKTIKNQYDIYMNRIDFLKHILSSIKNILNVSDNLTCIGMSGFLKSYILDINNAFSSIEGVVNAIDKFKLEEYKFIHEEYVQLLEKCKIPRF